MKKGDKKIVSEIVTEPVYRYDVLFIAGCSFDKAKEELSKYGFKDCPVQMDDELGALIDLPEKEYPKAVKGTAFLVWIKSLKDFYTMSHETAHLAIRIFEDRKVPINDQTTEAFAYYQEFWNRSFWRMMSNKR